MSRVHSISALAILLASAVLMDGCASSNPKAQVDPIFQAVPGGRYHCYYDKDNRNVVTRGATSTPGQAAVGGALGGLVGNQFGSGTGQDIATGVGAAAGVAAGAWNAQRMRNNRINHCIQQSGQ